LRDAYDNDTTYGFQIIFPSGNGFKFLAEVRQHTWSSGTNGVVAATFSLRLKGKPVPIDSVLKLTTDLPSSLSVAVGAAISMAVVAAGGKPPYAYTGRRQVAPSAGRHPIPLIKPPQFQVMQVITPVWLRILLLRSKRLPQLPAPLLSVNGDAGLSRHG
jgi:hypothetical protein